MSRSDSAGRAGARGSRRARNGRRRSGDAAPQDTVVDTGPGEVIEEFAPGAGDGPGDGPGDEVPPEGGEAAGEAAPARRGKRNGKRKKAGKGRKAEGAPPRRGRRSAESGVDPVSKFSATALRKVSVLGDRPNQVVNTLAEQSSGKRGTAVLGVLLGLCGVALVALLGVLFYLLLFTDNPLGGGDDPAMAMPEEGHSTLLPTVFQGESQEQKIFDPIAERPGEAEPLDAEKVFGSDAEKLELDDLTLTLKEAEATDTCTRWVWGEDLGQALVDGGCTSAARGFYQDADEEYVAQFTLFDLSDAEASSAAAQALDPRDHETDVGFLVPMDQGVDGLHQGYSQASAQVMGHYLAVYWVARADAGEPDEDTAMAKVNVVAMDAAVWVYEQVGRAKEAEEG
ncbi:hypothetical protein [Nocardiopsis suaedae]|uniref:Uncharacterized protein n=1 Tax=Nocardiopsis suaedae TaxID=3018444 RepID=A0ABT4TW25_9ACTN|nr:hypothetical protein [Nocardiopsis suaedae]MDA2808899.1 hypothetical protein [Nocardiopsis suaedae]